MSKPMLYVDFNEMLEPNLVLLSTVDTKVDADGNVVMLGDGLEVVVYMEDTDAAGHVDNLLATGIVEKNRSTGWGGAVKWCCRIDADGVRHQSEC